MKRKVLALIAIASVLALSGCNSVNSAAKVGKVEITLNTVESSVNDVLKERKGFDTTNSNLPTGKELNTQIIRFHVLSALFDALAKGAELKITDGDLAKQRAMIIEQLGSEDKLPGALVNASLAKKDFDRYLRTVIIANKMTEIVKASGDTSTDGSGVQKLLIAAGKHEGVSINPKYGVWNYTSGSIDAAAPNSAVK